METKKIDALVEPDGAGLLDDLLAKLKKYVVFPDEHSAIAVTLWTATTHALPAFEFAPRLVVTAPQKQCGKSRLLDVVSATCHANLSTIDATIAAVFRSLGGDHPPTLIIDEVDAIFGSKRVAEQNEDLRKLLNAGHQRGRTVLRCAGPLQTPTHYQVFAMAALAGIGNCVPDTITDRAVNITLRRRAPGETVAQFRSRRDGADLAVLRDQLAQWAKVNVEALSVAEPDLPVEDRAADTWEPLVAVADLAGGRWPDLARSACEYLTKRASTVDEEHSLALTLLVDIRQVFEAEGADFLGSRHLVNLLKRLDESPWGEFELTVRKLANRLREFQVHSRHSSDKSVRGYYLSDFSDAFMRYIQPAIRPDPRESVRSVQTSEDIT